MTAGPSDTAPLPLDLLGGSRDPRQADYPAQPPPPRGTTWLMRAAGLVGVAVASGLIFLACQPSQLAGTAEPRAGATGQFTFDRIAGPAVDANCAAHSFGQTQQFLKSHPCQRLTRALYSTTMADGLRAVVSVAVVRMASADIAQQLHQLTNTDKTGNVYDLVKDGGVQLPDVPTTSQLQDGGYAAATAGNATTIALSAFVGGHQDRVLLRQISAEALRLAAG